MSWSLRVIALAGLILIWAQPAHPHQMLLPVNTSQTVTLDPPQQVQTNDPRVCVHTRLIDEVQEYKIQETLRLVRKMGASTIVDLFPWAYVERNEGSYDWSRTDLIVKHAENQGLRVIARLGLVPLWAQQSADESIVTTLNYLPEERFGDFADYVGAFAERYRGRVDHLIIWNEPNLNFEWGGRPPDPDAYTRLLALAYEAAHAANPDVIVLGGALAPTLAAPGGAQGGWNDLDFLREMYEAGAGAYFDGLAVHNYPFEAPPNTPPDPEELNFRRIELWRAIMVEYGDAQKPVYITETGWNDHPRFVYGVSPRQRINYTLEAYDFTQEAYPWLETICLWQFRLPAPTNSYPDYFTLVSTEFQVKPIYTAIQRYASGWEETE
ncbi:MAG: hypothetical protein GYB66_08685 [Chloroflexi bacterium]|nr:hypothetical protein [Chloroflexota bacterium]